MRRPFRGRHAGLTRWADHDRIMAAGPSPRRFPPYRYAILRVPVPERRCSRVCAHLQCYLRANISASAVRVGPFWVTFDEHDDNVFLNYAIPDDGTAPTAGEIAGLVAEFRARARVPRLEYVSSPEVDAALSAAGFIVDNQMPLLAVSPVQLLLPHRSLVARWRRPCRMPTCGWWPASSTGCTAGPAPPEGPSTGCGRPWTGAGWSCWPDTGAWSCCRPVTSRTSRSGATGAPCVRLSRPTPIEELTKLMCEGARRAFGGLSPLHLDVVRGWTRDHVDRSARRDRGADPGRGGGGGTPRGHRDHGARPAGPGDRLRRRPGRADRSGRTRAVAAAAAAAWVQRRDGREAARELVAALGEPHRETPVVLAGLGQLEELVGEHSGPAVQTLLGRPRDGLAVHWLMSAGALSARDVEPERLLVSGRGHPRGDPGDRRTRGTRRRVRYR